MSFAVLNNRAYRRLWFTGGLTGSVRWLEILAISLYVLDQSDSPLLVSLLIFLRLIPPLLLGPWVGAVADYMNRLHILRYALAGEIALSLALMLLALSGWLQLWHLAIGVLFGGAFWSLEHTVRRPLIGTSVGDDLIGRALSLDSATFNATRMVGPLVGGTVFSFLGMSGVFLCSSILYSLSFFALMGSAFKVYRPSSHSLVQAPTFRDQLRDLSKIIRSDSRITAVLTVTVLMNFFGFPYTSMAPIVGERVLELEPLTIGVFARCRGRRSVFWCN